MSTSKPMRRPRLATFIHTPPTTCFLSSSASHTPLVSYPVRRHPQTRVSMHTTPPNNDPPPHQPDMNVYRNGKRRLYNGDLLPFDVSIISPPPTYLGRFRLDSRTHCGDVLEHDGSQFVVKRVKMVYKYGSGGLRVIRKEIDVKSLARKALEGYLERVLRES